MLCLLGVVWLAVVTDVLLSAATPAAHSTATWSEAEEVGDAHGGQQVNDADIIVAIGSTSSRLVLAQATRAWRSGIRTYIATNSSEEAQALSDLYRDQLELYDFFPDEPEENKDNWRANYAGDYRAGLAPWLAHRFLKGKYKWMLYGDDDTLFFMPGVRRLISQYDPSVPLALTDNLWYNFTHPRLEAPRCLPCAFDTKQLAARQRAAYVPQRGCPHCTRDMACPADLASQTNRSNCGFTGAHGGAGVIISVAMMERLSFDDAVACMAKIDYCSGSDCLFSECMWAGGYGFTDPAYALR